MRPAVIRVMIKDVIDFSVVFLATTFFTYAVYRLSPVFTPVPLSIQFFEQILEVFFTNHKLVLWALGLGLSVNLLYFLFCLLLSKNTLGGLVAGIKVVDVKTQIAPKFYQWFLMALGGFAGVLAFLWGPLYAWWLDTEHRGWSEKLSKTMWRSQHDLNMRPPV